MIFMQNYNKRKAARGVVSHNFLDMVAFGYVAGRALRKRACRREVASDNSFLDDFIERKMVYRLQEHPKELDYSFEHPHCVSLDAYFGRALGVIPGFVSFVVGAAYTPGFRFSRKVKAKTA